MIIRLNVENFLSFNDKIELLLTPSKGRSLKHHIIKGEKVRDVDILKSAIIYGANASGKSNIVNVISFLKRIVTEGNTPSKRIKYSKFKLDKDALQKDSQIEIEFYHSGINYAFGIVFNNDIIVEEWLYSFNKEKDKKIYERKTIGEKVEISFGDISLSKEVEKRLSYIGADTLPSELFLHSSNQRNITDIVGIHDIINAYKWFEDVLTIVYPNSKFAGMEVNINSNAELKDVYHWFLSEFKTGITGLETIHVDFFSGDVNLPKEIKENIVTGLEKGEAAIISSLDNITYSVSRNEEGTIEAYKLMTKHQIKDSDEFALFEINEESDGTQRVMDLIPAITELSKDNKVFVIDEIDRSLHPKLTYKFFELFFNESATVKSQLICTTHESELLNQQLFRKDEIWFVKKNKYGASTIYSLEEFRPRKDKDIRTGYLKGRFEAIPNFSKMDNAPWKKIG